MWGDARIRRAHRSVRVESAHSPQVRGTGSAEGLLERFMEEQEEAGEKGRPRKTLKPVPERRVIQVEEEFGYLLVKAHSQATTNLRETFCELWYGVNISGEKGRPRKTLTYQGSFPGHNGVGASKLFGLSLAY